MGDSCVRCATPIPGDARFCSSCGSSATGEAGEGAPPALPPRYRVVRFLGRGGMGRVFLCHDEELKVDVAVKVLPSDPPADPESAERIRKEARLAARLRGGPGILPLYAFEEFAGSRLLVQEFAAGGSLLERLRREGPLPEAECRRIGAAVAGALAFAHGRKVLHRDVKTSNILLDGEGRPRLADFGLAKVLADASSRRSDSSIAGTPIYMAPEVIWHGRVDPRSDLYSLGCVLHEIATGERPFEGSYHEIARRKRGADAGVPDPRARNPALSAEFAAAVRRLLAPRPQDRFPDGAAVAAALGDPRTGSPLPPPGRPPPPVPPERPRPFVIAASERFSQRIRPFRRPLLAAGAAVVAAAMGLAAWTLATRQGVAGPADPATAGREPRSETGAEDSFLDLAELPDGVEVFVDGRRVESEGSAAPLPPGPRDVTLVRPGFVPVNVSVDAPAAGGSLPLRNPEWIPEIPALPEGSPPPPTPPPDAERLPPGIRIAGGRLLAEKDGAEMVLVPGGTFTMGDDGGSAAVVPAHEVTLSPFLMDRYEVTNRQFARFVAATGYVTDAESLGRGVVFHRSSWATIPGADWRHPDGPDSGIEGLEDHPAVQLSWNDAESYARWAGRRLPTEAEFEYALRARREGLRYPWGDEEPRGGDFGNLPDEALAREHPHREHFRGYDDGFVGTAPVGSFPPNAFGLFDLSGNATEKVNDFYHPRYYHESPGTDPPGPGPTKDRCRRGGGWASILSAFPCVARGRARPSQSDSMSGFRCASDLAGREDR